HRGGFKRGSDRLKNHHAGVLRVPNVAGGCVRNKGGLVVAIEVAAIGKFQIHCADHGKAGTLDFHRLADGGLATEEVFAEIAGTFPAGLFAGRARPGDHRALAKNLEGVHQDVVEPRAIAEKQRHGDNAPRNPGHRQQAPHGIPPKGRPRLFENVDQHGSDTAIVTYASHFPRMSPSTVPTIWAERSTGIGAPTPGRLSFNTWWKKLERN